MKIEKTIRKVLTWLPSIMISIFFIRNGLDKIFQFDQTDKVVTNQVVLIIVGSILLFATALFLVNKTMIWGTAFLALYMTCIVFIHMYKEKPFEVAALIVLATVLAAYIRKPQLLHQELI